MAELIFFESFLLLLLGLGFCELDGRKLLAKGVHVHTFYAAEDFTEEEIARGNRLAQLVLEEGRFICKFCGEEGIAP